MEFDSLWKDFLEETLPLLQRIEKNLLGFERFFLGQSGDKESAKDAINQVLGDLHTVKGNSGMMGLSKIAALVHQMEDHVRILEKTPTQNILQDLLESLDQLREGIIAAGNHGGGSSSSSGSDKDPSTSSDPQAGNIAKDGQNPETKTAHSSVIRVDFRKLDNLLDSIGELLIQQTSLVDALRQLKRSNKAEIWERVETNVERFAKITSEIQDGITKARMLPIETIFSRFLRTVRDLARKEGKKIRFQTQGGDVEVDKSILDVLAEPLVHLVRNSIGHGIETPEQRKKAKKSEEGQLILSAQQNAGMVQVFLEDDGKGIDPKTIVNRAKQLGIPTRGLSKEEIQQLIFLPGFSTAARLSSLSGRGVGLDVVKRVLENLGGHIEVSSSLGTGTRFSLHIPLSLSLIRALLVDVAGEVYAIPLSQIIESFRLRDVTLRAVAGGQVVQWRGTVIPVLNLIEHFHVPNLTAAKSAFCVVVKDGTRLKGLTVSNLLGQQEIVAKSLRDTLGPLPGISGATLLGNGRVVPIVDVLSLASRYEERV